jgi:tripeptide aminopeptidase
MNRQRLLDRFLQYVRIDTTAHEQSSHYPSTPGQLELGRLLAEQLRSMGLADARQDEHGIVTATIPGNLTGRCPVIAFNSHVDTSPETTGAGVQPQVIQNYSGGDLVLPGDPTKVISVKSCPELSTCHGHTLITTDGTTLLGGDDKAGVAIMMELAQHLLEHPEIPHGPVRLLFTCDEEIGRGTQHVDPSQLGAHACYTFDGGGRNQIDHETFSADLAVVTVRGVNIHPSIAKDRMVNAVRIASSLLERLPRELSPERTAGRAGFLHPYTLEGGVAQVVVRILLRDFETSRLADHADVIRQAAGVTEAEFPGCSISVEIRKQYRNMSEGLIREPRAVQYAVEAHQQLGRTAELTIVRGGTDGSQLTEKGLPTPNLSSGQHNIHSPLEWASLDEMLAACEVGVEIVRRWGADCST